MSTLTREVYVHDGRILLEDLSFADNTALTVIMTPKFQPDLAGLHLIHPCSRA